MLQLLCPLSLYDCPVGVTSPSEYFLKRVLTYLPSILGYRWEVLPRANLIKSNTLRGHGAIMYMIQDLQRRIHKEPLELNNTILTGLLYSDDDERIALEGYEIHSISDFVIVACRSQ